MRSRRPAFAELYRSQQRDGLEWAHIVGESGEKKAPLSSASPNGNEKPRLVGEYLP